MFGLGLGIPRAGHRSNAGSFSPADISGGVGWYEPKGIVTDGSSVSAWTDSFGNGNDLADGGSEPAYVASAINGHAGIQCDAGESMLRATWTGGTVSQALTIFSVSLFTTTDSTHAYNAGSGSVVQCQRQGTDVRFTAGVTLLVPGPTPGDAMVTCVVHNGASSHATVSFAGDVPQGNEGDAGSSSMDGISIGTTVGGGGNYYRSPICEVIVYDRELTDEEEQQVKDYLLRKYSVTPDQAALESYGASPQRSQIDASSGISPAYADSFSLQAWAYLDTTKKHDLVAKGYPTGSDGFVTLQVRSNDQIRFAIAGNTPGQGYRMDTTGTVNTGEWILVTATFDAGTVKIYYNTTDMAYTTAHANTNGNPSTSANWWVGALQNNFSTQDGTLDGQVTQAAYYNKVLSIDEITASYNNGHLGKMVADNADTHWNVNYLDKTQGISFQDETGTYDVSFNSTSDLEPVK